MTLSLDSLISERAAQGAAATDLEKIRYAVADAASVSAGLWLSYLFVLFYLLIAVGGVTHSDLFFEHPVKRPFLNVDLPLIGFSTIGPILFLVVHTYVLLHFVLLAYKVRAFEGVPGDALAEQHPLLPINIFVQLLAKPRRVYGAVISCLLQPIIFISLAVGPIALLVFFQLQFLPCHHAGISWWQRIAIIIDIVLLWMLWPLALSGQPVTATPHFRPSDRGKFLVETIIFAW
jgi:hypothetical protein